MSACNRVSSHLLVARVLEDTLDPLGGGHSGQNGNSNSCSRVSLPRKHCKWTGALGAGAVAELGLLVDQRKREKKVYINPIPKTKCLISCTKVVKKV